MQRGPRGGLRLLAALAVGVDDGRELGVRGVEARAVGDHRRPELVQQEDLLREVALAHEAREVVADGVDLVHPDGADLGEVHLVGAEAPLRVERDADVRLRHEVFVRAHLREEVGAARLEVQHDVHPASRAAST